mgnify:CR=1 FL=1
MPRLTESLDWQSLNALSGIGCIRTKADGVRGVQRGVGVLMPCRALDAFGPALAPITSTPASLGLNALSGIGCIRTYYTIGDLRKAIVES